MRGSLTLGVNQSDLVDLDDATLPSDPKTYFEGFNSLPQDERFEKIEEFFLRVQSRAGALGVQVRDVTIDEPLIIAEGQEWKARSLTCRATTRVTNKNGAVAVVYLYKKLAVRQYFLAHP